MPTETIGIRQCPVCAAEQLDHDNFCRRCGVDQGSSIDLATRVTGSITGGVTGNAVISGWETRPLSGSGTLGRAYSKPLIRIVTHELSERTSSIRANRWAIRLVSALVAVPLWIMIVLLSPLDAYVAAKDLAKQV
ncbi:MAG: hypothetical protein KF868_10325 [Acidobacteria bacterium]|nr:hypothetical protein [Acidobacteriota bacterium]